MTGVMHPIIPSRWQVPPVFLQRLGEKSGRQRLMTQDGHLLLVLHKIPKVEEEEREPILFWRSPDGAWQSTESGAGLGDFKEHIASFDKAADQLDRLLRSNATPETYFRVLQQVTPLMRAAKHLTGVLQQAREVAAADRNILLARDEAVEIERHLELLHAEALHGLQFMVASRAEQQARQGEQLVASSHRLNLLVALCLPATAFASVLGMNVRHGLEDQATWVFWIVLSVAVLIGIVILALVAAPVKPKR
jgi:hypothetical protein